MGEHTGISWTDHTFNPVKGCDKVSPGCKHCYAEADTKRYGLRVWGSKAPRIRTTNDYWKAPRRWNKRAQALGKRERVFCASWADVGEDHTDWVAPRRDLARLIEETPLLDWLLLTKRPENLVRLFADAGWSGAWPHNVWAGTTAEDWPRAQERVPLLLRVPARLHFVSAEPLLSQVNLLPWLYPPVSGAARGGPAVGPRIGWVIVGGESGNKARPFELGWARDLLAQCQMANVPFFFKQAGAFARDGSLRLTLNESKGGDLGELPPELRVREFPR